MAIQTLARSTTNTLLTVEEIMAVTGLNRFAAELYLAGQRGEGLANDRVRVPVGQREAILREQEEAEAAFLAAMEHAAAVVDPAATVEENIARTGLDRRTIETYLSLRRGAA